VRVITTRCNNIYLGAVSETVRLTRLWAKDPPFGAELAEVTVGAGTFSATGIAIGAHPVPYRLQYRLTTGDGYTTRRLLVRSRSLGWRRALDLRREEAGWWTCRTSAAGAPNLPPPGGDAEAVSGALDCDLGLSPLTNSMPVLRHRLHEGGGPLDFVMAWVSVPDLAIRRSHQRYTYVRADNARSIVRYESLDAPFVAEIVFDRLGIVLDYPGIARHIA
jgi:uncharacterized protein